ncbi:MAG TPA: hypothetical protein VIK55_03375 [Paludibacter sp.]
MEVIKRIVTRKNFRIYNIPDSFGEKAEVIILPYKREENTTENNSESYYLMKAQEQSGSISMLNEPEEDAWNEL